MCVVKKTIWIFRLPMTKDETHIQRMCDGLTHKKVPSGVANCRNVPFAGERRRGSWMRFPKEERCAESPPTFICGKRRKNRRKPVKMKILSSGVVFTFEEGEELATQLTQASKVASSRSNSLLEEGSGRLKTMATPPASPPSPPPPHSSPLAVALVSLSTQKRTCKVTRLRSLATRPPGAERPVVNVDPATGKADGLHKKKLRTYLGVVARDKVDVTYETWKEVPAAQKDLIWEDIQFKSDLIRKWALAADQDGVDDTVCEKYGISKKKWAQFCQTYRDPSWEDVRKKAQAIQKQNTSPHVLSRGDYEYLEQKLMAEKTKKSWRKLPSLEALRASLTLYLPSDAT
ncbi:hypothetical protein HKD37_06G016839 [Glycine soja]